MKKTLLMVFASLLKVMLTAQSLTPVVIASAGLSYTSPSLQVDMTLGETFITTLQAPELIVTQGFHQPAAMIDSLGCIDTTACNYNANATIDDSSCTFGGCTDMMACNYDLSAVCDNGSCQFQGDTCDDGNAASENDMINVDCICSGDIIGCNAPFACNYDSTVTLGDFSCVFPGTTCDDGDAATMNDVYGSDCICLGEMVIMGCADLSACNYDVNATQSDGSCLYIGDACDDGNATSENDMINADCVCSGDIIGCNAPFACNYDSTVTLGDFSCVFPGTTCDDGNAATMNDVYGSDCICLGEVVMMGCTDIIACNYDSMATTSDSSCYYPGDSCDDGNAASENDMINSDCICSGDIIGCNAPFACNYDSTVTLGDFSCVFPGSSCDDGNATTMNDVYGSDCICLGEVVMMGCTDIIACNYDSMATTSDSSCYYPGDSCDDGNDSTINDVYTSDCSCVGVLSIDELESLVQVYPNPASTEVIVTINGITPNEVQIFDAAGRRILSVQRTARIDIQSLAAGHYTLRVLHDSGQWEKAIIKL